MAIEVSEMTKTLKLDRYEIRHHTEEAECTVCGYPMYVGERATEMEGRIFCGAGCAQRWHSRWQDREGILACRKKEVAS